MTLHLPSNFFAIISYIQAIYYNVAFHKNKGSSSEDPFFLTKIRDTFYCLFYNKKLAYEAFQIYTQCQLKYSYSS